MIIPDNVTVYMNGRAYYAHVCGFYWEGKRLSLQIDTSSLKGSGAEAEVDRTDPPRREITINAQINGKSVNITYDPHDAEAVRDVAPFGDGYRRQKDELKKASAPLVEYLKRHGDPHTTITVTRESAVERQDERGVTFESEKPAETVKRGRWEKSDIPCEKYVCSVCGGACWYYDCGGDVAKSRFCPNCGARMENALGNGGN